MTLIKFIEFIAPQNHLQNDYTGIVVDNNDPEKLNRIKVVIESFMDGKKGIKNTRDDTQIKAVLPWITPHNHYGAFGRSQIVPEVGEKIRIFFQNKFDLYSARYDSYFIDKTTSLALLLPAIFGVDYPNVTGYLDSTGTYLAINKIQETIDFKHSSNFQIKVSQDGKAEFTIPDEWKAEITKNLEFHTSQTMKLNANNQIELNGSFRESARKMDATKHFCPVIQTMVPGFIDDGDSKVKHS